MKIVIIGTSNSVIGATGYIQALRLRHDVTNLSTGRVGIAFHINRLLEHWDTVEAADLLIVDHYINDMMNHGAHLGPDYAAEVSRFLDILACLNTHVVNLLFPFQSPKTLNTAYYTLATEATRTRGISLVDLNTVGFRSTDFSDNNHLTHDASYGMGLVLSQQLARADALPKPSGGTVLAMPYKRYRIADLAPELPLLHRENKLMAFDYAEVDTEIALPLAEGEKVLALGYFVPPDRKDHQGIAIGPDRIALAGDAIGYFHEILEVTTSGPTHLRPLVGRNLRHTNAMGRGLSKGSFAAPLLVDMTTRNDTIRFAGTPAQRQDLAIDMRMTPALIAAAGPRPIAPATIDAIRDKALALAESDLAKAYALLKIAAALRPNGAHIQSKLKSYAAQLEINGATPQEPWQT